jgi:hypothetical protein
MEMNDPIHTIAAHVAALSTFDIAAADCGRNMIPGLRSLEEQKVVAEATYRAKRFSIVASMDVAEIVPTTEAGRQALAAHLQDDRYREEVENGRQLNDHAARTGERFTAEYEIVDAT